MCELYARNDHITLCELLSLGDCMSRGQDTDTNVVLEAYVLLTQRGDHLNLNYSLIYYPCNRPCIKC